MSLDAGDFIRAWMGQDAGVGAIIGTGSACNCFPMHAAEDEGFPRVTYLLVHEGSNAVLKGRGRTVKLLAQIDCWAEGPGGYETVRNLAAAVCGTRGHPKLDGFRGAMGGLFIQACQLESGSKQDLTESPDDGSDDWTYRVTMQFRITYEEIQ